MPKSDMMKKLKSAGSAHSMDPTIGIDSKQKVKYIVAFSVVTALLVLYGAVIVFSAVRNYDEYNFSKQVIGIIIGIVIMLIC